MIYRCEAVFDVPSGPYVVLLKGGGDAVRLECPPHEFGPFRPDATYRITIEKVESPDSPVDLRAC